MTNKKPGSEENDKIDGENAVVVNPNKPYVLMVCHGGAIRQLFYYFIRNISSEFEGTKKRDVGKLCPNTGVSNFDIFVSRESGKAEFLKCNMLYDGSHLIVEDEKILYEDHAL